MEQTVPLSELGVGQSCIVAGLTHTGAMRSRLCELGFVRGAQARCLMRSFSGDPSAYLICGAVIALRRQDAEKIAVLRNG
ncbi:MAG: ferrous iron transport protein A [Ruminococcus sp.]|nr:ferrous iron transport protein A [Ruminococcus sp.]